MADRGRRPNERRASERGQTTLAAASAILRREALRLSRFSSCFARIWCGPRRALSGRVFETRSGIVPAGRRTKESWAVVSRLADRLARLPTNSGKYHRTARILFIARFVDERLAEAGLAERAVASHEPLLSDAAIRTIAAEDASRTWCRLSVSERAERLASGRSTPPGATIFFPNFSKEGEVDVAEEEYPR